MVMFDEDGKLVFELTREETDRLFDPFDGEDPTLTMVQYKAKKRWIKESVKDRFEQMIGPYREAWDYATLDSEDGTVEVWFTEKKYAMTFKLMFLQLP